MRALGGLAAIAISHPHYYTTMAEWGRAFGVPVWLHADDRAHAMRADPCLRFWEGETQAVLPDVTLAPARRPLRRRDGGALVARAGRAAGGRRVPGAARPQAPRLHAELSLPDPVAAGRGAAHGGALRARWRSTRSTAPSPTATSRRAARRCWRARRSGTAPGPRPCRRPDGPRRPPRRARPKRDRGRSASGTQAPAGFERHRRWDGTGAHGSGRARVTARRRVAVVPGLRREAPSASWTIAHMASSLRSSTPPRPSRRRAWPAAAAARSATTLPRRDLPRRARVRARGGARAATRPVRDRLPPRLLRRERAVADGAGPVLGQRVRAVHLAALLQVVRRPGPEALGRRVPGAAHPRRRGRAAGHPRPGPPVRPAVRRPPGEPADGGAGRRLPAPAGLQRRAAVGHLRLPVPPRRRGLRAGLAAARLGGAAPARLLLVLGAETVRFEVGLLRRRAVPAGAASRPGAAGSRLRRRGGRDGDPVRLSRLVGRQLLSLVRLAGESAASPAGIGRPASARAG